jgi:acetyl esterase/lipase
MIVLPGGGYRMLAPHEAEPIAEWAESLGWRARIVRYPVQTRHPGPIEAVRAAIREERAAGAEVVGVIGFSAGGHLAGHALLAPDSSDEERPDLAVLGYPVVSMLTATHSGSQLQLLGPDATEAERAALSLERLVTPESRPVFLWHTVGDPQVPIEQHGYPLGMALAAHGVPHELHVLPGDVHGVALAEGTPAAVWTALAADFLARHTP